MFFEPVNEQLLRAIGVGVALIDAESFTFRFRNPTFAEWFGEPITGETIDQVLDGFDLASLAEQLEQTGEYAIETQVRKKRRTLVIEMTFRRAEYKGDVIIVLESQNISRIRELETMIDTYAGMVERKARDLEREKERVEKLLLNIMPKSVYEEFKTFGVVTPQLYDPVSVLMLDFVGFTSMAASADPTVTVSELNEIFTAFDRIAEQYGCERIKTLGDAYLAVAGLPHPNPDHARAVAQCAVRFIRYLERRNQSHPHKWTCRIGLASGSVVGSVVGVQKYVYDVFGPAVNLSSRLQALSDPMEITCHADMMGELIDEFDLADIGTREVRGFGEQRLMKVSDKPARRRPERDDAAMPAQSGL